MTTNENIEALTERLQESIDIPFTKDELFALLTTLTMAQTVMQSGAKISHEQGNYELSNLLADRVAACGLFLNKLFDSISTNINKSTDIH